MLKNIKVLLSIMIVAMLALGFITGCGSSSDDGGGGTSGGTVTGTVTDTNNNPLSGVGCTVITTDTTGKGTFTDTTDTDGVFLILGITPDGTWPLTLEKTGYITITTNVTTADGQTTEVPANETQMPVATTGNLTGTVTDATSGAALSDVSVALGTTTPVTTGTDGVYTFSSVTAGTYTLAASKTGYDDYSASVTVIADQTTTHNFTMEQSGPEPGKGKVVGLVTDSTGAGLSGVTCTTGSTSATTDSSGNYSLNNLTPGSATITFTKTGYNNGTVTVTVVADTTVTATTVVLVAGGTEKTNELCSLPRTTEKPSTLAVGAGGAFSGNSVVSDDGGYVVFEATQPLLATHITTSTHVYLFSKSAKTVKMMDVDPTGLEGVFGANLRVDSLNPFISGDGTLVAFDSDANNLLGAGNDANGIKAAAEVSALTAQQLGRDVFGYEVSTGKVFMISVDYSNTVLGGYWNAAKTSGGPSSNPSLSTDGTYCAFQSQATNLVAPGFYTDGVGVAGDNRFQYTNIYRTKITKASVASNSSLMISQRVAGNEVAVADFALPITHKNPFISGDGRFITYDSNCGGKAAAATTGLVAILTRYNAANRATDFDVFLCDTNKTFSTWTSCVSMSATGQIQATGANPCTAPTVSDDGRYVTFHCADAAALWVTGHDANMDVWMKDMSLGSLKQISNANAGVRGASAGGMVSGDGKYVVFHSAGTGFVQNDTNLTVDVFLYTVADGTFTRVNTGTNGEQTDNTSGNVMVQGPAALGGSYNPFISGDTNYVTFTSDAKNIATNVYYTPATFDVYLKKWK